MAKTLADARSFLQKIQSKRDKNPGAQNPDALSAEGRKNVLDLNILVCVDVSGSIGRDQFIAFMRQVDAIRGLSRVKVMEIDTEITALYDYFKTPQGQVMRLGGGGGTAFQKAFDMARGMEPDAILFMTDGFVGDSVSNPGIPTGWVLTADGVQPYRFGEIVARINR